ncbi:MAG: RNA ligase RtcB family protein [Pseudomonadota bacterium]
MGIPIEGGAARERATITTFYSQDAWVEGKAETQLAQVASWPGVRRVAAFPDLHPGKYGPVGSAVLADRLYPQLIGNDIGCGMAFFQLDLPTRKLKVAKASDRLRALEGPCSGGADRLRAIGLTEDFGAALGTIGGGNHFCEVQVVQEDTGLAAFGVDPSLVCLLVHSGSRGLGNWVLETVLARVDLVMDAECEAAYRSSHDHAVAWAVLNRQVIAERAASALRADLRRIVDVPHNLVEPYAGGWLHRKGAASADRPLVPLAGSRETSSYLLEPMEGERNLHSLAHGAGRKYDRASMHGRVGRKKSDLARMTQTSLGGRVICEDRDLLIEEAATAYKRADMVVQELEQAELARSVGQLRPVITFKRAKGGRA